MVDTTFLLKKWSALPLSCIELCMFFRVVKMKILIVMIVIWFLGCNHASSAFTVFFKKFYLLLHIQANRGLQAGGAPSAVLSAAMGLTSLAGQMATSVVTMAWHEPK